VCSGFHAASKFPPALLGEELFEELQKGKQRGSKGLFARVALLLPWLSLEAPLTAYALVYVHKSLEGISACLDFSAKRTIAFAIARMAKLWALSCRER
jgi:hypothetical protein